MIPGTTPGGTEMHHTQSRTIAALARAAKIPQVWLRLVILTITGSAGLFAQCTFTVTAPYFSAGTIYVDASSQTLTVQVTASVSTCAWNASGNSFATISGSNSATGNGSVAFTITQNPSTTFADRSTTLTIAGQSVPLIQRGTAAAFSDVFPPDFDFNGANILTQTGVTAGCAAANPPSQPLPLYCPNENVTRGQMAAFLVRMINSDSNPANASQVNNFQYSTTPYFTDVVAGPVNLPDGSVNPNYSQFFKYIQKLRDLGVTSGTTATQFSPNNTVTRDQMAKFIVLARLGATTPFTYNPNQVYFDAPAATEGNLFKFIQKLGELGVTSGCAAATSATNNMPDYCPSEDVTRGQMAIFLIRAGFNDLLSVTAPILSSVSPNSGAPGASVSVTLTGLNTHFASGSTTVTVAGGITAGTPTVTDATHLTVLLTIPPGTPLGPVSITALTPTATNGCAANGSGQWTVNNGASCEQATAPNGFVLGLGDPVPTLTSVNPTSGPIGTMVTLAGTGLVSSTGIPVDVQMVLAGGGVVSAPVTSSSATSVTFVVPSTAQTGAITVAGSSGTANTNGLTPNVFTVTPSNTYSITAAPSTGSVIAGQTTTFTVTATSSNGFTGLASLSLSGLPNTMTASFNPAQISAGGQSTLTITTPANAGASAISLTVNATATVDGITEPAASPATLNVMPITTSFVGRTVVDNTANTSIAGVVISMVGQDGSGNKTTCTGQTISDSSGNFALTNLPASCLGPQLIGFDGNSVTSPAGKYAGLQLVFTLVQNTVVASPVLVHLPRVDNVETFMVTQNATTDQTYVFQSIPGLSVTVYAGTTFTEQDGTTPNPFPLAAIEVPVDRLPDIMPPTTASVTAFIVAFQPAETNATKPVAVSFPNTLNTPPGTDVPLMTLDPTLGRVAPYGTGTVSSDGTTIIPDVDPSSGALQHRYGIVHFDWHGPAAAFASLFHLICGCFGDSPKAGEPVDLSSGVDVFTSTDISLNGNRGSLSIERTYRSLSGQLRAFGIGSSFNYDYRLDTSTPQTASMVNVEFPNGTLAPFARQADGTMINQTTPILLGAVLTTAPDGTAKLQFRNGSYFTFAPGFKLAPSVLTSAGDPNGNVISIVRNPSDPRIITEIDDPVGRKLTLTWNSIPAIASITDPIGRVVRYTYNPDFTLATFTNTLGGVTKYSYASQQLLASVTDPRGIVIQRSTFDANGRVATQVNAAGGTYEFISSAGDPIPFGYQLINPLVPTSPVDQASFKDPLGNMTTYRFNSQGYVVGATDASGQARVINRASGTNLITSMTGPGTCPVCGEQKAGDVFFTYDSSGNLLTKTDALGNVTTFTYSPVFNSLTSVKDPLGNIVNLSYDVHGNLTGITDPNGNTTTIARDSNGLVTSVTDPAGNTTSLTHDPLVGDVIAATDALNEKSQFMYDAASRLSTLMDPLAQTSKLALNAGDETTALVEANGRTTQVAYDTSGHATSYIDPDGNKTQFGYDTAGRVSSKTDPLNRIIGYQYDAYDNLIGVTNRRGQKEVLTYDALNRVASETYADATVQRSYDAAGRLIRVTDSQSGVFSFTYDAAGRLVKSSGPNGTVQYVRDAAGRVTSRQAVGEPAATYSYDANGNLTGASMGSVSVTRTYDKRNLLTGNTRSNGVSGTYAYDALGRISTMTEQAGANTLLSRSLTYGPAGDLTGDSVDKGRALSSPAATGTFDAANELTAFGATTYTNDADGNRISQTSSAGTTSYTWDARGRLQAITAPGGVTTSFLYDYAGRMIQKRVTSTGSDDLQKYVLDDVGNIISVDDNGTVTSILDGRTPDDIIAIVQGGSPVFPLADQISSESVFTDGSGNSIGSESYDPFGAPVTSGTVGLFGFTGQTQIGSGIYYFRARFYDSVAGRFLSPDPTGLAGRDSNLYRYVGNNPLISRDPTGLSAQHETPFEDFDQGSEALDQAGLIAKLWLKLLPRPYEILGRVVDAALSGAQLGLDTTLEHNDASADPLEQAGRAFGYAGDIVAIVSIAAPEIAIPALTIAEIGLKVAEFGIKCYDHYHNEAGAQ